MDRFTGTQWIAVVGAFVAVVAAGQSLVDAHECEHVSAGGQPAAAAVSPVELTLDGCEPFALQGEYELTDYPGRGETGPDGQPPMHMAATYVFTDTSYDMEGYPPLAITGDYEVIEVDGARMHVRFFNTIFNGEPRDENDVWLQFSDCGAAFEMNRMSYTRVTD